MIRPEDIQRKATSLYRPFQLAWLDDQPFFPRVIPCDKTLDSNLAVASESVQQLRNGSKERIGFGYTVEWEDRNSRTHGRNRFPRQILFETQDDFLGLIGKEREFAQFARSVSELRKRYPQLAPWVRAHPAEVVDSAAELDGQLQVLDFLVAHPWPQLFARELPLPLDTKFVERNRGILRSWLDLVLPPHAIRADEEHFDRRFGLRYVEPLISVRFLDEAVRQRANLPWSECAIPLHSLASHPIAAESVLIVENKINLLTLPPIAGAIALGGLGNSVSDLRYVTWLSQLAVWYWGDIDVDGFEILSRLRTVFPNVRSLFMDQKSLIALRPTVRGVGNGRLGSLGMNLLPEEAAAFQVCSGSNLRIEQERIPQDFVVSHIQAAFVAR